MAAPDPQMDYFQDPKIYSHRKRREKITFTLCTSVLKKSLPLSTAPFGDKNDTHFF